MENEPTNEVSIKQLSDRISALEFYNLILYCLIIVFILSVLILLYSLYKKSLKKSNHENKTVSKYELSGYITIEQFNQLTKRMINELKNELNLLSEKSELNKKMASTEEIELNSKQLNQNENKSEQLDISNPKIILDEKSVTFDLTIPPPQESKSFYMPSPSGDYFLESNASENFKPTVSLYKFYISKDNPNQASFEFLSDEMGLRNAISYPDRYLEPVCEEINSLNSATKKIVTIEKGIVLKNGDKWVVHINNKAKIKYE